MFGLDIHLFIELHVLILKQLSCENVFSVNTRPEAWQQSVRTAVQYHTQCVLIECGGHLGAHKSYTVMMEKNPTTIQTKQTERLRQVREERSCTILMPRVCKRPLYHHPTSFVLKKHFIASDHRHTPHCFQHAFVTNSS